jgi:hypothetical protein
MSSPHSSPQNVGKGRRRSGAPHGSPHVVGEGRGGIIFFRIHSWENELSRREANGEGGCGKLMEEEGQRELNQRARKMMIARTVAQ